MSDCNSFAPQITCDSKVLILGSMPGVRSLELQQYYAHPQNRFWKVMGLICECSDLHELDYSQKLEVLLNHNFALWDVIGYCKREGSLDSAIYDEVPNKINELLNQYQNIKTICLNGNKSYAAFKKYFPDLLEHYQCYKMPSTSPANARYSLDVLYDSWKIIIS
ncbi:DNA-deoxyinosine glycosylase [bacterium]|nr:DNA-deoxyinosine glycosylase [bacterium]